MKKLSIHKNTIPKELIIELPFSKSESNRLLIAQAISGNSFDIANLSDAEDTRLLQAAIASNKEIIDVGMAGTAFRFLTAYYAIQEGRTTTLTGADRMKQRPIGILVDALRELGASIEYMEEEGFPPLKIHGKKLNGGKLKIDGGTSSQFISALMLIAPALETPLQLEIQDLVSKPYVDLTLNLMQALGAEIKLEDKRVEVDPSSYLTKGTVEVGTDWSSAAFFYQIMAFSRVDRMLIKDLKSTSFQGDKYLSEVYQSFGISTEFTNDGVVLRRDLDLRNELQFDLIDCPDLIPSVAVTAAILSKECYIQGVSTLRVKESNRVEALKNELSKINTELIDLGENEILVKQITNLPEIASFETYNDHRMAMCLAPLIFLMDKLEIENPGVVDKSFPNFWKELEKSGLEITRE